MIDDMDPEELTAAGAPARADVPPETRMGAVHLTVADLDRSLAYYETQIGLRVHASEEGRAQLDTDDLLATLEDPTSEPFDGLAGGTVMGHVHLCVADVEQMVEYYRDVVGFGLMAQLGDQAAFLSAGGYHHHLGGNTWQSAGRP